MQQQKQQLPPDPREPAPAPTLNGGLYTGQAFPADAPWRNFPAAPEAGYYLSVPFAGVAPPGARYQVPGGGLRPGNSTPLLPEEAVVQRFADMPLMCAPRDTPAELAAGKVAAGSAGRGFSALYHF